MVTKIFELTQEILKENLHYDPHTGFFYRRVKDSINIDYSTIPPVGSKRTKGYVYISVLGGCFRAHRLAWLYVYGRLPDDQIDHINCIRDDNRISNLRESTNRANSTNKLTHKNGKLVGCHYHKGHKKWQSQAYVGDRNRHIGYFETKEEAHEAYKRYIQEHNLI